MVNSPPAIPEITHTVGDDGSAGGGVTVLEVGKGLVQTCLPVFRSSANRWLSIVTRNNLPL